jgi:hypothetical protein
MSMSEILIYCFMAHLVGDYILQTDWMALNKKSDSFPCFIHATLYSIPFMPIVCFFPWFIIPIITFEHFLQDRTQFIVWLMKKKGSEKFMSPPCGPWSIIVTDNIIHILFIYCLLYVMKFI